MSKMINNNDKHNLQIVAVLAVFIITCTLIFIGTRYVPLKLIAIVTIAIEVLFLMPQVCKMYCDMYQVDIGLLRYVPVVNFLQIFSPWIAKLTLVAIGLVAVSLICMLMPMTFIASIFGERIALYWTVRCFVVMFCMIMLLSICIGIGYCDVLHGISTRLYDMFNIKLSGTTWLYRILLFLPVVRISGLVFIYSQLVSLRMHNYGNKVEYNDEYYEEEN